MIVSPNHVLGRIKFFNLPSSYHSRCTSIFLPFIQNSRITYHQNCSLLTRTLHTTSDSDDGSYSNLWAAKICGITGALILGIFISHNKLKYSPLQAASLPLDKNKISDSPHSKILPVYTKSQVAEHYDKENRIWVTFKNGVYDITDFLSQHPGGSRILMAAGSSLEPFWELYPVHKRQDVYKILEKYQIGTLADKDVEVTTNETTDAFSQEPQRHSALIARSKKPFNGETPPSLLSEKFYTPNELFYIRNHLPVPVIDMKNYELEVEGVSLGKGKSFTLQDIKKLPKVNISATIQCGGNRRSEMNQSKPVAGLAWSGGAIGTATWTGARLTDVLKLAGFCSEKCKSPEKLHVQFEGLDSDPSGESYGASIPLSYILDGNFQGIIAYEMNGTTLPLDHGFPFRIVLPGIVGARSVKWLAKIIISDKESQSPWQQRDYKTFSPSVTLETVDYASSPAIMDTPVTSYICSHENGQTVPCGDNSLSGYAFSGGGRDIVRVELSIDQGKSWNVAPLLRKADKTGTRNWAWVLWEAKLNFAQKGEHEIWVKAVDTGYNQQTENFKNIWNYRGLLSNAYHKVKVNVE